MAVRPEGANLSYAWAALTPPRGAQDKGAASPTIARINSRYGSSKEHYGHRRCRLML
jgi:hypothetical protein